MEWGSEVVMKQALLARSVSNYDSPGKKTTFCIEWGTEVSMNQALRLDPSVLTTNLTFVFF